MKKDHKGGVNTLQDFILHKENFSFLHFDRLKFKLGHFSQFVKVNMYF
jgi:hypothetical protein